VLSFGQDLRHAARENRVVPRLLADRPEEWRLGPLTVVVDRRRGSATVRYARVPVARARCQGATVMTAWRRALAALATRSLPPDTFLPALAAAYRALLAAAGRPAGERVPLVELRESVARAVGRGYRRAQFAWDLARLRRERRLVHDGWRVDVGVATGMQAGWRSRVVWLEDAQGSGQYHAWFRLLRAAEEGPSS
jgi:hypothetical protein